MVQKIPSTKENLFDLYLKAFLLARKLIEIYGTKNPLYQRKFAYFSAKMLFMPRRSKNSKTGCYKKISNAQSVFEMDHK